MVLVVGGYMGWQLYQGRQMANQYASDAQKLAQGSGDASTSANSQTPGSKGTTSIPPSGQTSPSSSSSQTSPNSSNGTPQASGTPSSGAYKPLMSNSYQQTLQAMQNVKSDTLALQGKKISLSAYKASILQAQATFSAAEEFVRAHPPTEAKLDPSYQEFLAGISLAKESMGVVLNGISSFSPSKIYAAREMGKLAQRQVINGYSHF